MADPDQTLPDSPLAAENFAQPNLLDSSVATSPPRASAEREKLAATPLSISDDGFFPQRRLGPATLVTLDSERIQAAGLRTLQSPHLTLITDHPPDAIIDQFNEVFEQAVPQWVEFFSADSARFAQWQVTCFFILDVNKFRTAGLLPPAQALPGGQLPPGGWAFGNQIWVNHHPGDYYNRHMLLHEATHAFCYFNFGDLGPAWLAEGLAEHLALHRWENQTLELAARVTDKEKLAYWGRVKLIQDAWRVGIPKSFDEVLNFQPADFPATESYAWSWAAVQMLDTHPSLGPAFRTAVGQIGQIDRQDWTAAMLKSLELNRQQLETQWQVMTCEMEYGYDLSRAAIDWQAAVTLPNAGSEVQAPTSDAFQVSIPADGAWHATGLKLAPGTWSMTASGRYQIGEDAAGLWWSEPEGITLEYYRGQALGKLQFALIGSDALLQGTSPLTRPQAAGHSSQVQAADQWLYLRVNDDPRRLADNRGSVDVELSRQK